MSGELEQTSRGAENAEGIEPLTPAQVEHLEAVLKNFVTRGKESGAFPVEEFAAMADHTSHSSAAHGVC